MEQQETQAEEGEERQRQRVREALLCFALLCAEVSTLQELKHLDWLRPAASDSEVPLSSSDKSERKSCMLLQEQMRNFGNLWPAETTVR